MEESLMFVLSILPPEHRHTAEAVLAWMAFIAVNLAWLKPLAAKAPVQWRTWLDAIFKVLDLVAANTRGLHTRPVKEPKK